MFLAEVLQQISLLTVPCLQKKHHFQWDNIVFKSVDYMISCEKKKKILIWTLLAFLNRFQTYVGIHASYEGEAKMIEDVQIDIIFSFL